MTTPGCAEVWFSGRVICANCSFQYGINIVTIIESYRVGLHELGGSRRAGV